MGVRWFTDALALSAHKQAADRRRMEFEAMQEMFLEDPQRATDALVLGWGHHQLQRGLRGPSRPRSWLEGSSVGDKD